MKFLLEPWPWYVAGPLIGLVVPLLLVLGGKPLGISANLRHMCAAIAPGDLAFLRYDWRKEGGWNLLLALGILVGGFVGSQLLLPDGYAVAIAESTRADLQALGLRDLSGRRRLQGEDDRSARAPEPHLLRLDWRERRRFGFLLPDPQPRHPHRVRSPDPVALQGARVPGRPHIHAVVRTPNGNDYGKTCCGSTTRSMRMTRRMGISSGSPAPCPSLEVDLKSSRGAKAESCQARVASAYARKSATSARASRCRLGWGLPIAGC